MEYISKKSCSIWTVCPCSVLLTNVYSKYSLDQTTKGNRYISSLEYRINRYKSTKQTCTWLVLDVYINILLVDVMD